MTALLGGIAVLAGAGLIGDGRLTGAQATHLRVDGADWIGVAAAFVFALGLRSGSRGGPLALERAEVRHVLLAPVDRTTAMRAPAIRQFRFLLFAAALVGAVAGVLAAHRLPGDGVAWTACGALAAVVIVAFGYGTALCASGWRIPSWAGSVLALVVVAWAMADAANIAEGSPFVVFGRLALWPLHFDPIGFVAIGVAAVVCAVGLSLVGNVSVEAAERRSTLVGQLRFAATLQDVRTVIVLRRQLAMELPRLSPWVHVRVHGTGRLPVWTRGVRGVLRWPAARVGRLALLGVIAGLSARAAWTGTTPMVAVAGVALFIAALDAVEPLAQEIDHPSRRDSVPHEEGWVEIRHVPVAIVTMVLVCAVGYAAALVAGPSKDAALIGAVCIVPAALGAVAGALVSVVAGAPSQASGGTWSVMPPEVAGMRLVYRTAFPPALAIIGTLPVLAARAAARARPPVPAPSGAAAAGAGVAVVFFLVCGWVRMRGRIHAWWGAQMELSGRG